MAPQRSTKNNVNDIEYSFPKLLATVAWESMRNFKKTTSVSVRTNDQGIKVIHVEIKK